MVSQDSVIPRETWCRLCDRQEKTSVDISPVNRDHPPRALQPGIGIPTPREDRMRTRKGLVALAILVLTAFFLIHSITPAAKPSRINVQNCERIRDRMTRAEVESILGVPPGDYRTHPTRNEFEASFIAYLRKEGRDQSYYVELWTSDEVEFLALFGDDQRAWLTDYHQLTPSDEGALHAVYWHARRLWARLSPGQ
jgi:hypothetical protein